ncbi:unnamed protein product [Microthlaspi erraticum]|uniref:RNase H type-1 domain-containing protein n=1 Tax=Microthlaspi erraticum TaxID=1685480 RepID=A0A6D2IH06_9BRAS|nr:unnamed protein product [Microthlaspi erraticum]
MNFQTDCADLIKMIDRPKEWPAFANLLDEVEKCKRQFEAFSLTHIPRTKNTKADKLARSMGNEQPNGAVDDSPDYSQRFIVVVILSSTIVLLYLFFRYWIMKHVIQRLWPTEEPPQQAITEIELSQVAAPEP